MAQPRTIAAKLARQVQPPGGTQPKPPFVPDLPGGIRRPMAPLAPRFAAAPTKPLHKVVVPRANPGYARWEEPPEPGMNPGSGTPVPRIVTTLPRLAQPRAPGFKT